VVEFATQGLAIVANIATIQAAMQTAKLQPAQAVIQKFGGPSAVAELLGIHRTRVSNWQRPQSSGGTGGLIPAKHQQRLLDAARERGLDLKAEHFFEPQRAAS
jgi:hypothetical protein